MIIYECNHAWVKTVKRMGALGENAKGIIPDDLPTL